MGTYGAVAVAVATSHHGRGSEEKGSSGRAITEVALIKRIYDNVVAYLSVKAGDRVVVDVVDGLAKCVQRWEGGRGVDGSWGGRRRPAPSPREMRRVRHATRMAVANKTERKIRGSGGSTPKAVWIV